MSTEIGFGTPVAQVDTTAVHTLGSKRVVGSKIYRYVYNNGSNSIVSGCATFYAGATAWYVSTDGRSLKYNKPAGLGVSTIANASYGWIQTGGPFTGGKTTTAVIANSYFRGMSHISGRFGTGGTSLLVISAMPFGYGMASASAGSALSGYLTIDN